MSVLASNHLDQIAAPLGAIVAPQGVNRPKQEPSQTLGGLLIQVRHLKKTVADTSIADGVHSIEVAIQNSLGIAPKHRAEHRKIGDLVTDLSKQKKESLQIVGRLQSLGNKINDKSSLQLSGSLAKIETVVEQFSALWTALSNEIQQKIHAFNQSIAAKKEHTPLNGAALQSAIYRLSSLIPASLLEEKLTVENQLPARKIDQHTHLAKVWNETKLVYEKMTALFNKCHVIIPTLPRIAELTVKVKSAEADIAELSLIRQNTALVHFTADFEEAPAAIKDQTALLARLFENKQNNDARLPKVKQLLTELEQESESLYTDILTALHKIDQEITRLTKAQEVDPALEQEQAQQEMKQQCADMIKELRTAEKQIEDNWNTFSLLLNETQQNFSLLEKANKWNDFVGQLYLKAEKVRQTSFVYQKGTLDANTHQQAIHNQNRELSEIAHLLATETGKNSEQKILAEHAGISSLTFFLAEETEKLVAQTIQEIEDKKLPLIVHEGNEGKVLKLVTEQKDRYKAELNAFNQNMKAALQETLPLAFMRATAESFAYENSQTIAPLFPAISALTEKTQSSLLTIKGLKDTAQKASLESFHAGFVAENGRKGKTERDLNAYDTALKAYTESTSKYAAIRQSLNHLKNHESTRTGVKEALERNQAEILRLEEELKNNPTLARHAQMIQNLVEQNRKLENDWNSFCFLLQDALHSFVFLEKMQEYIPLAGTLYVNIDQVRQQCRGTRLNKTEDTDHQLIFEKQKAAFITLSSQIKAKESHIEEKNELASVALTNLHRVSLNATILAKGLQDMKQTDAGTIGLHWSCEASKEATLKTLAEKKAQWITEQEEHNKKITQGFKLILPCVFEETAKELDRMRVALNHPLRAEYAHKFNQIYGKEHPVLKLVEEGASSLASVARGVMALVRPRGAEPVESTLYPKDMTSIVSPFEPAS